MRPAALLALAVGLEGGLFLLAWGLGAWLGASPLDRLTGSAFDAALGTAAALPPAAVVIAALRARVGWAHRLLDGLGEALQALLTLRPWQLALVAAAAGWGEEALFRGVAQPAVAAALIPWVGAGPAAGLGLAAGALLFGLAHPVSRAYVAAAAGFGVLLGWLLLYTGTLLAPVAAHAVYDLLLLLYLRRTRRGARLAGGAAS